MGGVGLGGVGWGGVGVGGVGLDGSGRYLQKQITSRAGLWPVVGPIKKELFRDHISGF